MDLDTLFDNHLDLTGDLDADLKALPGGGGVYAMTDAADRLVLLAGAEALRRVIRFRLDPPEEASKKRADLRAVVRRIRWVRTYSQFETTFQFHRIARVLEPKRYLKLCAFGPAWFVHVDLDDRLPELVATKHLRPTGRHLGPLPTRKAAEQLIETLLDLFDLCRDYSILQQVPHGQPCAYYEMGKCPAPCNASIPLDRYHEMMREAWRFASGDRQPMRDLWKAQMREHAARQEFEHANECKQRLQRAEVITGENYRFCRPIESFNYLILQRGQGTTQVKPFFVRAGCIEAGPSTRRKDLPAAAARWVAAMQAETSPAPTIDPVLRSEWVWLLSHFLFKGDRAPGLYLGSDAWIDVDTWMQTVNDTLISARARPEPPRDADAAIAEPPADAD